ncbi:alpha/beta hydrolase [Mycobacterium xenopi]|uniref:Thioesterase n=2 Tax=Mycobacterium xenopi TaxID=1789 RepID=A0AAD1GYU0_MYCXE|nr:alpha/beta hydrolase [Mycobacterium xenopi]MDA3638803.1 alpha/beta fold hydrolase [Mycobacterium xenopi]MDA3658786.1 alpha/beta fold hydrolase [Mycobacterium xenopi]MDA3663740.1 alpha/beta fold hydrolase [Mycobacterium xenopi]ORX19722.1 thioesterase [Mycobacterium xenopi]SPX78803.1 thioesterase [Mycobacterium xenopi]
MTPRARVVAADGVPMSALVAESEQPRAVVLALHGGGTTAAYFDCPGHPRLSLLRTGAALGFTVIALDRPGYGSSGPYPEAMTHAEQRVNLAYAAVERILGERSCGAGLFVMAHSGGCELALRMAADDRGDQLLGIELAGTGTHYHPASREVLKAATRDHRPAGLGELLWHPTWLYPPDVRSGITNSSTAPEYEHTVVTNWARQDFPALAAQVRVPVQFTVAEYEQVWQCDEAALTEITEMFSASPRVTINEQAGAGHNLSLGYTAFAYHLKVFAFVEQCVVAREIPAVADPLSADVDLEAG